jgi:hypothetical protein
MKNLFFADTYKQLLKEAMQRNQAKRIRFTALADAIRVQRPYLSKVMKGAADLNRDQLFLAASFLSLSKEEAHFAELLLERDRSTLAARKKILEKQISEIQGQHKEIKKNLEAPAAIVSAEDLSRYYLDPMLLVIHIGLTIPRFQEDTELLRKRLGFQRARFQEALFALEQIGLVSLQKNKAQLLKDHLHLPKDSPLFAAHQSLLRMFCLQHLQSQKKKEDTVFSVTFSATEAVRARVHEKFLAFIREVEQEVRGADPAEIYQMNFDLFQWSKERAESPK